MCRPPLQDSFVRPSDVDGFEGWSDLDVLQVLCGTDPLHDWNYEFLLTRMFLFAVTRISRGHDSSGNCFLAIVVLASGSGHLAQTKVLTVIFKRTRSFCCLYSQSSQGDPFDHKVGHCFVNDCMSKPRVRRATWRGSVCEVRALEHKNNALRCGVLFQHSCKSSPQCAVL